MKNIFKGVLTYPIMLALVLLSISAYSQDDSLSIEDKEWNIRPSIFAGVGMLNYRGDITTNGGSFNPFQNKIGWHVGASQPINEFLDLQFHMMFGKLGANERSLVRNLNFESRLTSGGIAVAYNFDHILPEKRIIEPFVSVGFEAFEFISKTDLIDDSGIEYNYWSDGTIRNLPETTANLEDAIEITRDYTYETDIRSLNADGLGDYSQRSFAIPVGAGFNLLMNDKMSFSMGAQYHWTFTDYIDGITPDSRGVREGNKRNDAFISTFMRLTFDFTPVPHVEKPDFSGDDEGDTDMDSVPDFTDLCPNTPLGIEVDKDGCPLDTDGDGVFDYVDAEINSPEGSVVDSVGVALSDAMLERMYVEFMDETGEHSVYTNESYSQETGKQKTMRRKTSYAVSLGEFEEGITDSMANVLLSMPDVTTRIGEDGKTIVEVGNIENLPDAIARKVELESSGITTGDLTENNASGETSRVTNIEQDKIAEAKYGMSVAEAISKNKSLPPPSKLILDESQYTLERPIDERSVATVDDSQFGSNTVYRVQLGAYANKLSNDVFDGINDLLVVTTQDGLTRYYTGAFTSYQQAASRKIDMIQRGFDGTYVVPFSGGQRVTLKSTGVKQAENVIPLSETENPNKGKVKFLVQIGAYKSKIPSDVLSNMMKLGRIEQDETSDGTVRYYTGFFNTYEGAKMLKDELISTGFDGAFVVAKFNGNIISANEGIELIK